MERMQKIGKLQPRSAAQVGPSRIGLGFEKLDRKVFEPEKAYDLVAQTGVHYVRIQSGWQRTETEKGKYDFAWLDDIVDQLIARGMEPWIDLCYGNQLYTQRAKEVFGAVGCAPIASEEERLAWESYVKAVVTRYHGKIQWYEIWNEPDGAWCWRPDVDAEAYGDFALATAKAIHEADPSAKAIAGVVCYINLPYVKRMLERGVAEEADAISFHRYNANELDAMNEMKALRALFDRYNPDVQIIQGESGTQSDSRGAGALRGGAWTPLKQAKYLLRHRLIDLATDMVFTSHFTAVDMVEALNGIVGDKASYLDFGYFGVIQADFNEDGLATGEYTPKLSYHALQHLCTLFDGSVKPADLPMRRVVNPSARVFGKDASDSRLVMLGFENGGGTALAYWEAADLMTETYDGTVSFEIAGEKEAPKLIELMSGDVYLVPEKLLKRNELGEIEQLVNLPLTDTPALLCFGDFWKG